VLCIIGSVVIVLHAPEEQPLESVRQIWQLARQPGPLRRERDRAERRRGEFERYGKRGRHERERERVWLSSAPALLVHWSHNTFSSAGCLPLSSGGNAS
jgi:hypothetical protein